MLFLFDRPLSKPLTLHPSHVLKRTERINHRLAVTFYEDGPGYLAVLQIDERAILWEAMVTSPDHYITTLLEDLPFLDFLLEYAEADRKTNQINRC